MEAVFYSVPVLCIPMFADQLGNAILVQRNDFGEILYKEDITRDSVAAASKNMIDRIEVYKKNMDRARYFMERDPSTSIDNIFFHIDYLIKYGNVDFLINEVISHQSFVEVYNLDIVFIFLSSFFVFLYILYTILKLCVVTLFCRKKEKTE